MNGREWMVCWQREGHRPRSKMYQTERGAERWSLILQGRLAEATGKDPDDYACCPGTRMHECACNGITNAESWAAESAGVPPLIEVPRILSRPVGRWS